MIIRKHVSTDEEKRARQQANLEPGQHVDNLQPGAGQQAATAAITRHGAYSAALVANVESEVREIMDALADAAPVRDQDGGLPAADVVAVERAARLLRRYRSLEAWLDLHGPIDEKDGSVKPAAMLSDRIGKSLDRSLAVMGMNPEARERMGVHRAQALSLADLAALRHRERVDAEATAEETDA